jgi:hypothetical protein
MTDLQALLRLYPRYTILPSPPGLSPYKLFNTSAGVTVLYHFYTAALRIHLNLYYQHTGTGALRKIQHVLQCVSENVLLEPGKRSDLDPNLNKWGTEMLAENFLNKTCSLLKLDS